MVRGRVWLITYPKTGISMFMIKSTTVYFRRESFVVFVDSKLKLLTRMNSDKVTYSEFLKYFVP